MNKTPATLHRESQVFAAHSQKSFSLSLFVWSTTKRKKRRCRFLWKRSLGRRSLLRSRAVTPSTMSKPRSRSFSYLSFQGFFPGKLFSPCIKFFLRVFFLLKERESLCQFYGLRLKSVLGCFFGRGRVCNFWFFILFCCNFLFLCAWSKGFCQYNPSTLEEENNLIFNVIWQFFN